MQLAGAGDFHRGEQAPALLLDRPGEDDTFGLELLYCRFDVVTHQVDLVAAFAIGGLGGMNAELGGREGEDQPSVAGVDGGKAEHVTEEGAEGVGFLGVDHVVDGVDHGSSTYSNSLSTEPLHDCRGS